MAERDDTKTYETETSVERFIMVAVCSGSNEETQASLHELSQLIDTAGGVVVGTLVQNLKTPQQDTFVGRGKVDELRGLTRELDATGIVCDAELTPSQMANLSDQLDVKVIDRTVLILDIFAKRASTKEGKIQVELAQLRYRATRLTGYGTSLSRQGGGIGNRGPGENKLEVDRRLIRDRISHLKRELEEVKAHSDLARKQRERNAVPVVAIVGYTNAGKSTIFNTLTGANVLEEDKLFATLDPTTRNLTLESGQQILLTDTVGFINKLPHHLIDAFRSTLEEARYADIILHMVDASNPQMDLQMHVVYETLEKLDIENKPLITAFNKMDLVGEDKKSEFKDFRADYTFCISARKRETLDGLLSAIEDILRSQKRYIEKVFDYKDAGQVARIRKYGQLLEEKYTDEGIYVRAYVPVELYGSLK